MSHQHTNERAFLADIKNQLDQSEDAVDDLTLLRLRRIRQQAVQSVSNAAPASPVIALLEHWWMPAASIAATVVITVMAFTISTRTSLNNSEDMLSAVDDMPILQAEPAPEFYKNLDFYLWLDEQKDLGKTV